MFEAVRSLDDIWEGTPEVSVEPPPSEACDQSRHARLFELLRQQALSKRVAQRVNRRTHPRVSHGDSLLLQSQAVSSFQNQRVG